MFEFKVFKGNQVSDEGTIVADSWADASKQLHGLISNLECHEGEFNRTDNITRVTLTEIES